MVELLLWLCVCPYRSLPLSLGVCVHVSQWDFCFLFFSFFSNIYKQKFKYKNITKTSTSLLNFQFSYSSCLCVCVCCIVFHGISYLCQQQNNKNAPIKIQSHQICLSPVHQSVNQSRFHFAPFPFIPHFLVWLVLFWLLIRIIGNQIFVST